MKTTAYILLLFFISPILLANDDLENIVGLAEDTRDVVTEMAAPQGEFVLSEETATFVHSLQEMDQEIAAIVPQSVIDPDRAAQPQDPCHDAYAIDPALAERIQGRKFSLYFTGTFSEGADLGLNQGFSGMYNYKTHMINLANNGFPEARSLQSVRTLESRYLSAENPSDWADLSMSERAQRLQTFAGAQIGTEPSLGLIMSEYAIAEMTRNPENWTESLNEIKDHLSFEEKLLVASHFGGRFAQNYNFDRADGEGPRANGIVTIEEMLESVRDGEPGGVCRDVSQAQSLMLQEMGVNPDNIYQVSYRTATGGHVVLAVQDPDDPTRVVKINYDYTTESTDRDGSGVLTENSTLPEFGMQYRIFDANGSPVARVPTEMGNLLQDVTGQRRLSDGLAKNYNLQRVYVDTPYGVGNVFTGTTASGDNIVGVAVSGRGNDDEPVGWDTDWSVAAVRREGDRTFVNVEETALYAHVSQIYRTPRIERGNISAGLYGGMSNEIIVSNTNVTRENGSSTGGVNFDVSPSVIVGGDVRYQSDDGRTRVRTGVEFEGFVTHKNEQEGPDSGYMLAPDQVTWSTSMERDISSDMVLSGESAIVLRNIGNSAVFTGGLTDLSSGLTGSVSYQTPLGDGAAFNPNSSEIVGIGVGREWESANGRVRKNFGFEYQENLTHDQSAFGLNLGLEW